MMFFQNMDPLTEDEKKFAEEHIGLVHFFAKRFFKSKKNIEMEYYDIFNCGFLGLMRAIKTYNPDMASFSTYASPHIRRAMSYAYMDDSNVRMPQYRQTRKTTMMNAIENDILYGITRNISVSMDKQLGDRSESSDGGGTLHDCIADDSPSPEQKVILNDDISKMKAAIDKVSDFSDNRNTMKVPSDIKRIILREVGINGRTMTSVGHEYGISRQRAKQIMDLAKTEMQRHLSPR